MRCFYVLKKWSSAKLSLNRDLSLNKMSLNQDCTVHQNSYTVHGLYRGQKVLEPQKFAVTLQWVGSEVNRGHLSPVGNVRGHLFPSQIRQSESQLPRLRLLIWVFGRDHPCIMEAKRWLGGDGLKVALSQKILENFYLSNMNIPSHYPEQKIWNSCLLF